MDLTTLIFIALGVAGFLLWFGITAPKVQRNDAPAALPETPAASGQPTQLNIKSLGSKIMLAGAGGLIIASLIWVANKPPAPTDFQRQQSRGSMLGIFAINEMQRVADAYPKCFYQGSDYTVTCPMGGNLHILVFLSAGLFAGGLLLLTSTRAPTA